MTHLPALLLALLVCTPAMAHQSNQSVLSNASGVIAEGSAMVVGGSVMALVGSGTVVVRSIEAVGEGSRIVLVSAAEGAAASIELSGAVLKGVSLAVGTSVAVVAISTGVVLITAGKVIAFIPNEIGKSLMHHSVVPR
jgi:hypothetical protein